MRNWKSDLIMWGIVVFYLATILSVAKPSITGYLSLNIAIEKVSRLDFATVIWIATLLIVLIAIIAVIWLFIKTIFGKKEDSAENKNAGARD